MAFRFLKSIIVTGILAVGLTTASFAAAPPAAGKPDAAEAARAQLASQMASYGIANKDPYSILAAVEALHGLHAKVLSAPGGKETYDPSTLLKAAKTYAANDPNLTKVIDAKLAQIGSGQGWYDVYGYYHCTYGYYIVYGYYVYGCY